jgi:hypothetical protein
VLREVALNDKEDAVRGVAAKKLENKTLRQLIFDSISFNEIKIESKDFRILSIGQIKTLIDIAGRNPEILRSKWEKAEKGVKTQHTDKNRLSSSDCGNHTDTKTSSGLTLPPYPFKD